MLFPFSDSDGSIVEPLLIPESERTLWDWTWLATMLGNTLLLPLDFGVLLD